MSERYGRQTPTKSVVLPYEATEGIRAIELYEASGRTAQEWQKQLAYDILATNEDGLYVHTKFGYSVPRRNGKGEILTIVELNSLFEGRATLHTAHRTSTSSSASKRLVELLKHMGYSEVQRVSQNETYEKSYSYSKQFGLERVVLLDTGGSCQFRTRTSTGGLGEGFDLLVIDEAQEYTDDQENTLQYTVSDSYNPQIIMCGTPPTAVSSGTVFTNLRDDVLGGDTEDTGWAEWSVDEMSDVNDVELWFECNPAMGYQLNERKVRAENKKDELDFNIQRLGLWIKYNQKSLITKDEWEAVCVDSLPRFVGGTHLGIKYGHDANNVAVSVAVKTDDGRIFIECLDCQSMRNGDGWILDYIASMRPSTVAVDGKNGQQLLFDEARDRGLKKPIFPTTNDIITGSALFMQMLYAGEVIHMEQPSVEQIVSNCDKRSIGSAGGYGFKSLNDKVDVAILDSIVLALFACSSAKEKAKQQIKY